MPAAFRISRKPGSMSIARNMRWRCCNAFPRRPKGRYITEQWSHGPDWVFYDEGGEDWFGFKGVRALGDREPDILMIPLAGPHARPLRHRGSGRDKWLLHAGDSYFFHGQFDAMPRMPLVLGISSAVPTWTAPCGSRTRRGCGR